MDSQRGSLILDYVRKFNLDVEVGGVKEQREYARMYNFTIPLGTDFSEVYDVLSEAMSDVRKMDEENKKAIAEKKAKEAKAAEAASTEEASVA